jgi:hypothetical protein
MIYAGIGPASPKEAGWYIYCNDRLVLEADKSKITGWDTVRDRDLDELGIQKYHNKFAMFRGVVFFESDKPELIPMTTTKSGIDTNNSIYRSVYIEMLGCMNEVLDFLDDIPSKAIRDQIEGDCELSEPTVLARAPCSKSFQSPSIDQRWDEINSLTTIAFKKDRDTVDALKDYFEVTSNGAVGERLFDFFWRIKGKEV